MTAEVLRKEVLSTDIGDFRTIVVRPQALFEGMLKTSGDSLIWLTDDERHFVLKVKTKIKIGSLNINVKEILDPTYTFPSRL